MAVSPPNIDERTAELVNQQLQQLIRFYAAPSDAGPDWAFSGLGEGLVGVAARFSEIVIQRLNQVPQKNFLAFLNLLGASLLPPQPARVPLTFYLAKGSPTDGLVPAGTQVAAPPGPNEKDPVIFETENELMVTAAQLVALFTTDPARDMYADYGAAISSVIANGAPCFHGNRKAEHILYIGDSLLGSAGISSLTLAFVMSAAGADPQTVQWEFWNGNDWVAQSPTGDGTKNLRQSGSVTFSPVAAVPLQSVNSAPQNWLRCRLMTAITTDSSPRGGMVRSSQLPFVPSVALTAQIAAAGETPAAAFTNQTPVDLTKDFYPLGEKPRLSDCLYLTLDSKFARAGASLDIHVTLANPVSGSPILPLPVVYTKGNILLAWELWNGRYWDLIGTSTSQGSQSAGFKDGTQAFTNSGIVSFALPSMPASSTIGGVTGMWIRVRIAGGHYGLEARWIPTTDPKVPYQFIIADFAPPVIKSLTTDYQYAATHAPEAILSYNDFKFQDNTGKNSQGGFAPFVAMQDTQPTFYFGFILPPGRSSFLNNPVSLFLQSVDLKFGQTSVPLSPDISKAAADPGNVADHMVLVTNPDTVPASYKFDVVGTRWQTIADASPLTVQPGDSAQLHLKVTVPSGTAFGDSDSGFLRLLGDDSLPRESAEFITYAHEEAVQTQQLRIKWEYWNGTQWAATAAKDNTNNFAQDGVVEFLPPPDFADHTKFGMGPYYWLRARWEQGEFEREPRLSRVLPNTVMGSQTVTILNEVLGSSDGSGGQQFQTARSPVLAGQTVMVREPEMPTAEELATIEAEEGNDAVTIVLDAVGQPKEVWVRWHQVEDFYASDAHSRHYTLNHLTGQIMFGDGLSGLIPPAGTGNLVAGIYKTGGGSLGNRAAQTIVQLKTTLPYVDKVTNLEASTGGAEAESTNSLIDRVPTEIRHRRRAVTVEDYEDLAHLASPDVARALCVPDRDLVADPFDTLPAAPGNVSVMIVPDSPESKPQPSFVLVQRVQQFLLASCPANVNVVVVGPLYMRVDVQVEIGLVSLDSSGTVVQKVQALLDAFLHPLTGGFAKTGWEFGRAPHRSDLYALLKQVPEADHVRSLVVNEVEDSPGTRGTGRFLVYSGIHTINLVYEPS
ncbi:MAG TPA: putative baseplate assembly protein [Candidatus Eisenbacteria bacterium]|nr:putative baseplate assembly protein [Candidatus Eisenbacteria bacterium]